jgi:hypothetical protein
MEVGVYTILTDQTMLPGETAKLIEDAGLDAMAMGEHSHIPSSRESAYPGGDLPAAYARTLDLFVTFSAGAAATTRLRFESSIIQIAQRDPITTAKAAASVDFLSGGRLDLIVGHGWNLEEMRNHGIDPVTRYDLSGHGSSPLEHSRPASAQTRRRVSSVVLITRPPRTPRSMAVAALGLSAAIQVWPRPSPATAPASR